jgi:hypothetical protein
MRFVEKVGYTSFYDASESDHRGAFMEISNKIIDDKIELQRPKHRDIGSNSRKQDVYKYKQEVHNEFVKRRIYTKVEKIHRMSYEDGHCSEQIEMMVNAVDKLVTDIVLKAEKNTTSKYYKSEWSIALHRQALVCRYWSTIKHGMKNGRRTDRQTSKLYRQMDEENQKYLDSIFEDSSAFQTSQIVTRELKRNIEIKRELVRHHVELRLKGMKQLVEIRQREGNKTAAKAIQKRTKAEENKHDWKVIQEALKPMHHSGISYIEVPPLK